MNKTAMDYINQIVRNNLDSDVCQVANLKVVDEVFLSEFGMYNYAISGGLGEVNENDPAGNTRWNEYFDALSEFTRKMNEDKHVKTNWVIDLSSNWPEDIFYVRFGIILKDCPKGYLTDLNEVIQEHFERLVSEYKSKYEDQEATDLDKIPSNQYSFEDAVKQLRLLEQVIQHADILHQINENEQ